MASKSTAKVKSVVTNTKGQKVTSYADGTKSYSGGSSSTSSKPSSSGSSPYSSPASSGLSATQQANETAAQAVRFGTAPQTGTITSTSLKNTGRIELPSAPSLPDVGGMAGANNAGLATNGLSLDGSGGFVLPQANDMTTPDQSGNIFAQYLKEKSAEAPPSSADIYAKEAKAVGLRDKQQEVANYSAQLNTIVANQNADLLRLRGTASANGVTEAVYGGQAATVNREAAIAALPVQAQLAAAQGNLELAQTHLDTMVKLKAQDAQAKYEYRGKLLDAVFEFATASEKKRLDARKEENDRAYAEKQDFLKTQQAALSNALAQGAPSSVYNAIKSATTKEEAIIAAGQYNGDVLARQIQQAQLTNSRLQAQKLQSEIDNPVAELLSVSEAQALGVPYGTTKAAAAAQGITPKDANASELTAAQKTKTDSINAVIAQMNNYRTLVEQNNATGVNIFGKDAATLRTAKSALEFAIASAVGTGALQAADREVVQDLLPDPTSLKGSAGILARGGKSGALASIDEALKIFKTTLSTVNSQGSTTGTDSYSSFRSQLQPGEILVNRNGKAVAVTESELLETDIKL